MTIEDGRTPREGAEAPGRPARATDWSLRHAAVAYLRHRNAGSVDRQRRAVEEYAHAHGLELVAVCVDVAQGDSLRGRDGLAEALRLVADGEAGVFVVARLDRIAGDVVTQEAVVHQVRAAGGEVVSVAGELASLGEGTEDPQRLVVRSALAVGDQVRTMAHGARQRQRRAAAEARGRHHGHAPYGRQLVDGELVDHPEEQAVIARMVELRAEGLSLAAIGRQLDAEGHRTRGGRPWRPQTLADVLRRARK